MLQHELSNATRMFSPRLDIYVCEVVFFFLVEKADVTHLCAES